MLALAGRQLELRLAASELTPRDAWALVADGFAVLIALEDGSWLLLKHKSAWRLDAMLLSAEDQNNSGRPLQLSLTQLKSYWQGQKRLGALLAQGTQAGASVSSLTITQHGRTDAGHAGMLMVTGMAMVMDTTMDTPMPICRRCADCGGYCG